jgi:SOS-response transcriptional repressor LexA
MHEIQKKLLSLGEHNDLSQFSYRQLAKRVGAVYAAQVRHHLLQLEKQGKIVRKADGSLVTASVEATPGALISIPVLGNVDCGVATKFATDTLEGYLSISPSSTKCRHIEGVFALKACGDSMNQANIHGKSVRDSDYILVKKYAGEEIRDGEYIVSLIEDKANLKKFRRDPSHRRIALMSESSERYPPILIAEDDRDHYEVIGKAVDVISGISHLR